MRTRLRVLFVTGFPLVTILLVAGCLAGFLVELLQGRALPLFLLRFGVVPVGLVSYFLDVQGASFARNVLPFFISIFLHGGVLHLFSNVLFLWGAGDVVEAWLGRTRYVVLFLFGIAAELIVRIGVTPEPSGLASVGVSGAVAAIIGGYVVILVRMGRLGDASRGGVLLRERLPLIFLALCWFPIQLFNPFLPIAPTCQTAEPVSWLALLMSFALGVFLVSLSGPGQASTPAEAVAFPREETAVLGA